MNNKRTRSRPVEKPRVTLEAQPIYGQRGPEIQPFGTLVEYPIGVTNEAKTASVTALNRLLVETLYLRDLYKKAHWQVSGPTFYQLHLLFDKHFDEQGDLIDMIGERIQTLGGIALVMANDVAELTTIERPPRGREQVPDFLSRLVEAHTIVLTAARTTARVAAAKGDDGTNNLVASDVIPKNEKQVWFLSEHLVDTPLVIASGEPRPQTPR